MWWWVGVGSCGQLWAVGVRTRKCLVLTRCCGCCFPCVDCCVVLVLQRRGPTASLAQAPKTPRYMSDIDPVGERERERRRKEKQRIYQQHKQATAAVAANRASAEGGIDTSQMSKEERRLHALQVNTRNPRDNFKADDVDNTDYLSNPSGHPDHDNMAERGRKRRQERQTILRQEEEKMQAEAKRRQASRDKAKKRRWLRERDAAARRSQKEMLDEENQTRGKGNVVVEDHGDEGDLSSDTDSDDDRRHTVNKAGIDAFVSGGGTWWGQCECVCVCVNAGY